MPTTALIASMCRRICWLSMFVMPALNALGQEYLIPERGSFFDNGWASQRVQSLHEVLLKGAEFTPYRARLICEPSFKTVWVVTLLCENGQENGGQHTYFVEYAGYDEAAGGEQEGDAGVRRMRVPIDRETGEAVQKVWLCMLRDVRHPKEPVAGADGVTYHFARFVRLLEDDPLAPTGWETGMIWTPDPNSPAGRLAALGEAMKAFALAEPKRRDKLRESISRDAVNLGIDLVKRQGSKGEVPM